AAIGTPILLPVIGWRGMFLLGIFPAVVAYFIRKSLHEPEVFIKKMHDRPKVSALHLLVDSVETTKLSIGMIVLTSVQNFGYYGVMIWNTLIGTRAANASARRPGITATRSELATIIGNTCSPGTRSVTFRLTLCLAKYRSMTACAIPVASATACSALLNASSVIPELNL